MRALATVLLVGAVWACACSRPAPSGDTQSGPSRLSVPLSSQKPWAWSLPPGLPIPRVPPDNPMSGAKVQLGRRLFYDTRLSGNGTWACGSCHQQAHAFTDGRARAIGSTGQAHPRSAMSLTTEGERGMALFFSDRLACARCHSGFNLSGPTDHEGSTPVAPTFHNTGLYNVDGRGAYPAIDRGLFDLTHVPADMGRFRAPTLRNIAVSAPYMHDGSVPTLEAAIAHYASGGVRSPLKSPRLKGFTLSGTDVADLVAFLHHLTDREFLANPAFADPRR